MNNVASTEGGINGVASTEGEENKWRRLNRRGRNKRKNRGVASTDMGEWE